MAFDGVPIGISDGLPACLHFYRGRCRVLGCPGLENALRAVGTVLVSSDRKDLYSLALQLELAYGGCYFSRNQGRYSAMSRERRPVTTRTRNQELEAVGADLRASIQNFSSRCVSIT